MKIYLEQLNFKDITVLTILLSKYFFIQQIEFSLNDPNKTEPKPKRKIYKPIILSKEEKTKIEKEKKNRLRTVGTAGNHPSTFGWAGRNVPSGQYDQKWRTRGHSRRSECR